MMASPSERMKMRASMIANINEYSYGFERE